MKEVTMVVTCEITLIETFTDEEVDFLEANKSLYDEQLSEIIKDDLVADHVNILKNQIFNHDVQEQMSGDVE